MRTTLDCARLKPGMRLGADARDRRGRCLLREGTALTDTLIDELRRRDVRRVCIARDETRSEEELAARRQALTRHIRHLFRYLADDPLMDELQRVILDHRMRVL
ncbi:hypothetical protein [Endothiovibrio diazotrophicus]